MKELNKDQVQWGHGWADKVEDEAEVTRDWTLKKLISCVKEGSFHSKRNRKPFKMRQKIMIRVVVCFLKEFILATV